jgi:NADPH2:quinone reductase
MKAIRVYGPGGPDVLKYEDVAEPVPGPLETLVKVDAAGVNYIDVYHRTGHYPTTTPYTIGQEAAGTVAAVGSDVRDVRAGDRVAYTGVLGGYAEYAAVPAEHIVALPDGVSTKQGGRDAQA